MLIAVATQYGSTSSGMWDGSNSLSQPQQPCWAPLKHCCLYPEYSPAQIQGCQDEGNSHSFLSQCALMHSNPRLARTVLDACAPHASTPVFSQHRVNTRVEVCVCQGWDPQHSRWPAVQHFHKSNHHVMVGSTQGTAKLHFLGLMELRLDPEVL